MSPRLFLLLIVLFFLPACALQRDDARFVYTPAAEGDFFAGGRGEAYNFFVYHGPGTTPVAFLALDKRYTLQSSYWNTTGMSPSRWQRAYHSYSMMGEEDRYHAKAIVLSDGRIIGYMLTRYYRIYAWVTEPGGSTVVVPPPALSPRQPEYFKYYYDRSR